MISNKYLLKIAGAIEDHVNRGRFLENEIRMLHAAHSGEAFPGRHIAGTSPAAKMWEQHHTVTTSGLHSPMHAQRSAQAISEYGSKLVEEFGAHSGTHQRLVNENSKRIANAKQKVADKLPSARPMPVSTPQVRQPSAAPVYTPNAGNSVEASRSKMDALIRERKDANAPKAVNPLPTARPMPVSTPQVRQPSAAPVYTPNAGNSVEASRSKMDALTQGRKDANAPKAVNPLPTIPADAVPAKPSVTEFGQGPSPKPVEVPRPGEIQTDIAAKAEGKAAEKGGAAGANWKRFLPKTLAGKAVAGASILGIGGIAASQMREKKAEDYLQKIAESGIEIKPSHQGRLHRDLGVPEGEPIPMDKLEAAKNNTDPNVRRRATFALNAKKWRH